MNTPVLDSKRIFYTVIVILIAFSIGSIVNPNILIILFLTLGIIVSILINKNGFLGVKVPNELNNDEKLLQKKYYDVKNWSDVAPETNQKILKNGVFIVILWIVISIILAAMGNISGIFDPFIENIIEIANWISWVGMGLMALGLYLSVILFYRKDILPDEIKILFREKTDRIILTIGTLSYLIGGYWGVISEFVSLQGYLIGVLLLPIALVVSRVEGKFFYLFTINQWSNVRNWDILEGEPIREGSVINQIKGGIHQFQALIAVTLIPLSILSTIIQLIDYLRGDFGEESSGIMDQIVSQFFDVGSYDLVLLFLTLGPLLVLLTRPFGFVDVWENQGLYEILASPWDLDILNNTVKKFNALIRFPQRHRGFNEGLFIASVGILLYLGLNFVASLTTLDAEFISFILEAFLLSQIAVAVIFLLTLVELTWDLTEEKTIWLFSKEERKNQRSLINFVFFGEFLLSSGSNLDSYIDDTPSNWGLSWYFKGLNIDYTDEERIEAYRLSISNEMILLPGVISTAHANLGALLLDDNKSEEAKELLDIAIKIDKKNANAWSNYGAMHFREGNLLEAEKALITSLKYDSEYNTAWQNYTAILTELEKFDEAEIAIKTALNLKKDSSDSWAKLGSIFERKEEYEKAIEAYEKSLSLKQNADAFFGLGNIKNSLGDPKESERMYLKALEVDPEHKDTRINIATLYTTQNMSEKARPLFHELLEKYPDDVSVLYNFGILLYQLGDAENAEKMYTKALEVNPKYGPAWVNLGYMLDEEGKVEKAKEYYQKAVESDPNYDEGWYNLGVAYDTEGQKDKAKEAYLRVIALKKDHYQAWSNLGLIFANSEKLREAEDAYTTALEIHPDHVPALYNMGLLLTNQRRNEEAEKYYLRAVKLQPDLFQGWYDLGIIYKRMERYSEAAEAFNTSLTYNPDQFFGWYNLGEIFIMHEQYEEAILPLQNAATIRQDNPLLYFNLGLAYLNLGNSQEGEKAWKQALEINPDYFEVWGNLGALYMNQGRMEEAEEAFNKSIEIQPNNPVMLYYLGSLLMNVQRFGDAEKAWVEALTYNSEYVDVLLNLGAMLINLDRARDAHKYLQTAVDLQPENPMVWFNYGMVKYAMDLHTEAEDAYLKAIELAPNFPQAYYNIACIAAKEKNVEKAIDNLDKAIKMSPDMKSMIENDADLKNISEEPMFKEFMKSL